MLSIPTCASLPLPTASPAALRGPASWARNVGASMFGCARARRPECTPRRSPDARSQRSRDFWLPFTPNRALKKRPRLISRVRDMHYFLRDARSSARAFTSISLKSLKPLWRLQAAMDSTAT